MMFIKTLKPLYRTASRMHLLCFTLILCLIISPLNGCSNADSELLNEVDSWSMQVDLPPETTPQDLTLRQKADVIVLPTISVVVWTVGVLVAYMSAQVIYTSTQDDFETLINGFSHTQDWSWADQNWESETLAQAEHLNESLEKIAYRSPTSEFYAITGNDYLRLLNLSHAIQYLDPKALKDLLDGKVRPMGQYAIEYMKALRALSMEARASESASNGFCLTARVNSIPAGVPYEGRARARNVIEVIPAAILASLKATTRCGMYDSGIREYVHGYFDVNDVRGSTIDIFISHSLKTAKLLYKYVDVCQLPPTIDLDIDTETCIDPGG